MAAIAVQIRLAMAVDPLVLNRAVIAVRSPQQAACCSRGKADGHAPEKKYDQASGEYAHGLSGLPDE
jgi:hypothetical protein